MPKPSQADVEAQIPMVRALVAQRFYGVPDCVAGPDDLLQIGMEAICKAAPCWHEGGASFKAFAYQRAWGGIQDWLRTASFGGRNHYQEVSVISLDAPAGQSEDGDVRTLGETIPCEDAPADPFVLAAIQEAVSACPLDVQSAFALRHEEDATLSEIGEMMGVTESRASQMVAQAHEAIAAHPALEGLL